MESLELEIAQFSIFVCIAIICLLIRLNGKRLHKELKARYPGKFKEMGFDKPISEGHDLKTAFYQTKPFFSLDYLNLGDSRINKIHRLNLILTAIAYSLVLILSISVLFQWLLT